VVNKSQIVPIFFLIFLLTFNFLNASVLSLTLDRDNVENNQLIDIRIIVDKYINNNKSYILLSAILYNLVNDPLTVHIIKLPYIKILYNNNFLLNQTINIHNKSLHLKPLSNITLFNTTFLISQNITLEVFSGAYVAIKYSDIEHTSAEYVLNGNIIYIEYKDRIVIGSGPSISLQSINNNSQTSFINIPLNGSGELANETIEGILPRINYPSSNMTENTMSHSRSYTDSLFNQSTFPDNYKISNNLYKTVTYEEKHNVQNRIISYVNYDLIIAFITTISIIIIAKLIVYILRRNT